MPVTRGPASPVRQKKPSPTAPLFTADGEHDGLRPCLQIPGNSARGRTAITHTHTRSQQPQATFTKQIPVSPAQVHGPSAHGCTGLGDGLTPSRTVGYRTYDRTSTTENVTYTYLVNIERVAHPLADAGALPWSDQAAAGLAHVSSSRTDKPVLRGSRE